MRYGSQRGTAGYKRQALTKCDLIRTKQPSYKSAVCIFSPSLIQDSTTPPPCTSPTHSALSHTLTDTHMDTHFPSLWRILVSGVLCFSSQGREESGLRSKLTINSTLPESRTRSNTSSPSLLLLLLPPLF